jgi:glycosyltransferase involved in cell wall biosynthesis
MISILLATYNGEKFIKKSIDSILNQSFKDFEILIGFNGTTDKSKDIVNKLEDNRIKIFDFGNDKGKSKTLNKLLKEARFEWVAIQDDDDIWYNNKLEKQINHISNNDVIGSQIEYIDSEDSIIGGPKLSLTDENIKYFSFGGNNQVANTSAIFRKKDAIEVNGWNENIDGIEDFDFWLKLMRLGKKFINLNECLVKHRIHSKSNFNTKKYNISQIL